MEKDVVSSAIGDFGRWQFMISLLMGLVKLSFGWFNLGIIFLAPPQRFWCKSGEDGTSFGINATHLDTCQIESSENQTISCTDFEYDRSIFTSTIISEWDLVCSRKYFVEFTQITFMAGLLLGFIMFGAIGDKYGRRIPLIAAVILQTLASFVSSLSNWYSIFIVSRFVLAISSGGVAVISFVLSMEVVGGKWRTIIPILYHISFGLGLAIMAGSAYIFRNWRHSQLFLAFLSTIIVLFTWLIPESPRWLLVTNQNEKALELLKKISKFNKRQFTTDKVRPHISETLPLNKDENKVKNNISVGLLFTDKQFKLKTLILCIEWFVGGIVFYAFSQYKGSITINIFSMIIVASLSSIPGIILCLAATRFLGRRSIIMISKLWTAISMLLILAFPKGAYIHDWPRIFLSSSATFGMSVYLPILYLYTGEIYPTQARNFAIGLTQMLSKFGSIIAPFVLSLERVSTILPIAVMSALTIFLMLLILALPETKEGFDSDTIRPDVNSNTKNDKIAKEFNCNSNEIKVN